MIKGKMCIMPLNQFNINFLIDLLKLIQMSESVQNAILNEFDFFKLSKIGQDTIMKEIGLILSILQE